MILASFDSNAQSYRIEQGSAVRAGILAWECRGTEVDSGTREKRGGQDRGRTKGRSRTSEEMTWNIREASLA